MICLHCANRCMRCLGSDICLGLLKAPPIVDGSDRVAVACAVRRLSDLDQDSHSVVANDTHMAFNPRQLSILEVAGVATIILSAVALAGVVYSIL